MKKLFLLLGVLVMAVSCVDLSELTTRIENLEKRMDEHEALAAKTYALKTAVEALEKNVYVSAVNKTSDGYIIKFTDKKEIVITNGKDGVDGKDATAPTIGVAEVDQALVWTVNGEVVKDAEGKPVPATVQVPEFKFDSNKWWYRFGPSDEWKDCGEKTGPEPSITETNDTVIITIGDKSISIPKEIIAPAIETITAVINPNRIFAPIGKEIDLTEWFEVTPEDALKSMVDFTPAEGAPFTVNEKGILTATAAGSTSVTVSSKLDPDIKLSITIRSGKTANVPKTTVKPDEKIMIYSGSVEEYNQQTDFGGSTSYNPLNGAIAGVFNGNLNFRIGMPVIANQNVTMSNGRLHFWLYISDVSYFTPKRADDPTGQNFLEHTSSGTYDANEIDYEMTTLVPTLKNGWNEIDLALKDFTASGSDGKYEPSNANFIRFLCNADTKGKWITYQMKDFFVYVDDTVIEAINPVITHGAKRLFLPVGQSVDLKEWFEVVPERAKGNVTYSFAEGAPVTISEDGILKATGAGKNTAVTIASKNNEQISTILYICSAECPDDNVPQCSIDPEEKIVIFEGSKEEYLKLAEVGGTTTFNPIDNSLAAVYNGNWNFRIGMPVTDNSNITMENGHLHFMFYVPDISFIQADDTGWLELTSSGVWDVDELDFTAGQIFSGMKNGWNEVDLKLSDGRLDAGNFDPSKANFIRFVLNSTTPGESWQPFLIKDLFVYAEDAPVQITIDGEMDEWAGVKTGLTSAKETPVYMEFKVSNDDNNIYFYSKRDKNTAIWGGGAYIYYEIDADNNPETGEDRENELGLETWLYFKPFGGSTSEPAIATEFIGESSDDAVKSNFNFKGKISSDFVEIEASLPLSAAGVTKGSTIRVFSWSNKSGDDFRGKPSVGLLYDVK